MALTAEAMLQVLKQIRDDLDTATNPSLKPQHLHELRDKVRTLIADLENEVSDNINTENSEAEAGEGEGYTGETPVEAESASSKKLFGDSKPRKKK
jgi:hypothetical protein